MHRFTIPALIVVFLFGCSETKKAKPTELTPEQKTEIESFSNELINSINSFDFTVINNAWNNEAFKERVSNRVNKTQQSVLNHIFEKDLRMTIKTGNLSIVHRVNSDQGQVSFLRLNHYDTYSELILLMTFEGVYDFFKYRIESINNKPSLTDFYHYTDNLWYSEKVINMLRMNSKYDAFSDERHQANRAMRAYEQALTIGNTLEALYSLYDIPETHQKGNWLSLRKLSLAIVLGDSVLADVMATERENNKSLYMDYLYNYYLGDTTSLSLTYQLLAGELGESKALDSLIEIGYLWNVENNDNSR